jgi:acetyltransferase-like isoleucine patch superfamily enzyme
LGTTAQSTQHAKRSGDHAAPVHIEDEVYIGPHYVIVGNVRIGRGSGSVIRAGTVVSRNVPAHTMWGAPPAEALAEVHTPLIEGRSTSLSSLDSDR